METYSSAGRVVVGSDGAAHTDAATQWAAQWANDHGLGLTLLCAHGPLGVVYQDVDMIARVTEAAAAHARQLLDVTVATVRAVYPNLDVQTELLNAHPAGSLIDRSATAALTVVGTRGAVGLRRVLLGGTADGVITHGSGPVAVVPPDSPLPSNKDILVGVDTSDGSAAALRFAFEAASATGRTLRLVHAWELEGLWPGAHLGLARRMGDNLPLDEDRERFLADTVTPLAEAFPHVSVEQVVMEGGAARILSELSPQASLIVVGSRGRAGFTGLLLGSTSRELAQTSECPVVVVHEQP